MQNNRISNLLSHPLTPRNNLRKFESLLSPLFREVGLIGEIPLSNDEEIEIEQALRELLRSVGPDEATQFLREQAPCTLAYFLVWKGIQGYHEGDYWTEVCQSVDLPRANWPQKWGESFEEVLRHFQLADFRDSGGQRFVTPILIHGGIPDYCLDDFFEQLLWPVVERKLDYDGNADYLITEWLEHSSLTLQTDKPVRRFLANGGKVAINFLQRSLDMAFQADIAEPLPSGEDFGLPSRVVERFSRWFDNVALQSPTQTHRRTDLPRYRAPEILLNPDASCLLVSFPSQRIPHSTLSNGARLTLRIQQDGNLFKSTQILGTTKGEVIETDPCDFTLSILGESYQVTLFAGGKRLRNRPFSVLSAGQPWLIFHGTSGKLLPKEVITERNVWIVFPASWTISTPILALEETTLARGFQAKHFHFTEGQPPDICFADKHEQAVPIPAKWRDTPTLQPASALTWPRLSSGEFTVYCGNPPCLRIPRPISDRASLTITPTGESYPAERKKILLKDLPETSSQDAYLTLSLEDSQLLGPKPCGRFIIQVRGRLGQDTSFRICILPEIKFYFPREKLLPDQNTGPQVASFTLTAPHLKKLSVESPAEWASDNRSYHIRVPADSEQVVLKLCFAAGEATAEVPLEIPVSRLRWAVSGLGETTFLRWSDRPVEITLQDLEDAPEARLLIRGDFGQDIACSFSLEGSNHTQSFDLKNGKGGTSLSPFLDSLRKSGLSRNDFYLEFSLPEEVGLKRICLVQVETDWRVEDMQIEQELIPTEDKRTVLFEWRDKGNVKNRALRLWSLGSQLKEPIEVDVEDNRSEAEIERSLSDFPQGLYRLELTVLDPWARTLSSDLPSPYGGNVFDIEVRGDGITILDSPAHHMDALFESITTGEAISDLNLDSQTVQVFVSQPEQAGKFCKALFAREEKWGDSCVLFKEILQRCGEQQDTVVESLTSFLIEQNPPDADNINRLFVGLCVGSGFLDQRWGPNLRQLLLSASAKGSDLPAPSRHEEELDNAKEEISALYAQATWQSLDLAKRFLRHLSSVSGELVYEAQRLLQLEKLVTWQGEEYLCWSCEKKGRRKTQKGRVYIPLKEAVKILPSRLGSAGVLCLTATFQRAGAYRLLRFPKHAVEKVSLWGRRFYQTRDQEYRRELQWAEKNFARRFLTNRTEEGDHS